MKVLFDYCHQRKAYQDSYGECLVELEGDETIQDVADKYVNVTRHPLEQHYTWAVAKSEYTHNGVTYTGRLVLMDTHQVYLD